MTLTLYGKPVRRLAHVLAVLGGAGLFGCVVWSLIDRASDAFADCRDKLSESLRGNPTHEDETGVLRIVNAWPNPVRTSGRLCVVVAGVAPKTADAQADARRPAVELPLFLNDRAVLLTNKPSAEAKPGPQLVAYEFGHSDSAAADPSKFWRDLLAGRVREGTATLDARISRAAATTAEPSAHGPLKIQVYLLGQLLLGAAAMVLLIAAFVIYAANSTVLRDNPLTMRDSTRLKDAKAAAEAAAKAAAAAPTDPGLQQKAEKAAADVKKLEDDPDQPVGTFSLGRTQMALWLGLTTAGFIFLWLTLGFYLDVITASILVLLGINGATGLASIAIDQPAAGGSPPPPVESKSFLGDLVCDANGPKLHRIQVAIWTCILALIFLWNTVWNFIFVSFDTNLLLLMGIANSMYLGFKPSEKA